MKTLTLAATVAALLAFPAFAQIAGPGQDRSVSLNRATPQEKAAAKAARKAEGRGVAKTAVAGDADPASMGVAKSTTKEQRKEAAMKRKAAIVGAPKEPRTPSGPN